MAKCPKCRAITKTGRRCQKDAIEGSDYCAIHQPVEVAEVAPEPQEAAGAIARAEGATASLPSENAPTPQVPPRDVVGLYGAPALEITSKDGTTTRVRTRDSLSTWGPIGANYADRRPCQDEDK